MVYTQHTLAFRVRTMGNDLHLSTFFSLLSALASIPATLPIQRIFSQFNDTVNRSIDVRNKLFNKQRGETVTTSWKL